MVMRQMRENTKWIMLVTALAFVALMVFQWGMDITGRSAGGMGELGDVNGQPVMYDEYMATYRNLYDQVQRSQEEPITSAQVREIEEAAWNEVVNRTLVEQELERRGIRVTNEEIRQAARFNPPQEFRQLPIFQTEGQFDLQKYQQYIQSPQADEQTLLYLENYFRDVIPRGKLMRQVTSGLYLTENELWRRWRDQNETVTVRYIPMNPDQRIPDAEVEITDREIQQYYDSHQDDFEVPARATVRAAVIRKAPTARDTTAARERAQAIGEELRGGAAFAEVAQRESGDQGSAAQGGELGVFQPGMMVPSFDSAAFAAPVGRVTEPVRSQFGYHVLEVEERWGQDSVRARHILVPVERTDQSELDMLTLADSLEDLSEDFPLAEAAQRVGLQVTDVELTDAFAFVPGAGAVAEGADWAFEEGVVGDVSPLFENGQAFYALELVQRTSGGAMPMDRARPLIERLLRTEKKLARAEEQAAEVVGRIRAGTSFPDAASAAGLDIREAGPFSRVESVPGLGRQNAAIGAAFGLAQGGVSDPVRAENNVFIIQQIGHTPADSTAWVAQVEQQRQAAVGQLQQQRLEEWMAGLREVAKIRDLRAQVLQPTDEQEDMPLGGFGF